MLVYIQDSRVGQLLSAASWQIKSKLSFFSWLFPTGLIMAAMFLCTFPLLSVSGKYQLFITAPDEQMPASTQWACWHMKSLVHSGQNTKHQQQDDGWKLRLEDKYTKKYARIDFYTPNTHAHTHKTTHVRPQPGPSDWLLLPACCILDRSMCSTYVWIICDPRWQEKKKRREKRGRGNSFV